MLSASEVGEVQRRRGRAASLRFMLKACIAAALLAGGIAGAKWFGYRVNMTPSLPRGIWRMAPLPQALARGQIVIVCPPVTPVFLEARDRGYLSPGACPGGLEALLKPVAAVSGDLVEQSPAGIAVNGRMLPDSAALGADSEGRSLPALGRSKFAVGPGEVFLLSTANARSFDGRYFGPVPLAAVQGLAIPVWLTAADGSIPPQ